MRKFFAFSLLFLGILSCKQTDGSPVESREDEALANLALPERIPANAKARVILNDWTEYQELTVSLDKLEGLDNNEELHLLLDELIEKEMQLADSAYPEAFDQPQVRSRQKVFKTYLLKVKAALEYRQPTLPPSVEMMEAFNDLTAQFNVIVNNALDTELILDE